MPLARVKTWNAGDILTAADQNAEFNNILNNPISLISPTTGAINFQTSVAHSNLQVSALTASSGTRGQALLVTSSGGSQWSNLGAGSRVKGLIGTVTSSQTVTLSADEYRLRTTEVGNPATYLLTATESFTVNVGTAGPAVNGRDIAAVFGSTFVHVYAITTGLGSTTPAGIASTTPPPVGPVLPTSYTAYGYLGAFAYSTTSTTFVGGQRARGSWMEYEAAQTALNAGAATSETAVSLVSLLPSNALRGQMSIVFNAGTTASGSQNAAFRVVTGSNFSAIDSFSSFNTRFSLSFPNVSQQVFYVNSTAGAATTLVLQGYSIPNGGE